MAVGVFDRLVLRILKIGLDEIKNSPGLLLEEYFVPSAVFRGSQGPEKSVSTVFLDGWILDDWDDLARCVSYHVIVHVKFFSCSTNLPGGAVVDRFTASWT